MSSKPFHLFGSPSRNDSVVVKDEILSVQHLVKKYGDLTAVNDISFSVKKKSLFAFLGQNGAGKSTTINIITSILSKIAERFIWMAMIKIIIQISSKAR